MKYTHDPECGYFATRFSLKGGTIPASIYMDQPVDIETGELTGDETLKAEILGETVDPEEAWLRLAKRPICKEFYLELMGKLI